MTGQGKLIIIHLPSDAIIHFLILHVPPDSTGVWTLIFSTETCRPMNSATDPLRNPSSIIAFFPSWGPSCSRTTTCTVFAVLCFIARRAWNVYSFSSHLIQYSPCIANWNKKQPSQYGGHISQQICRLYRICKFKRIFCIFCIFFQGHKYAQGSVEIHRFYIFSISTIIKHIWLNKYPEYAKYVKYVKYGKYVPHAAYVKYDTYVEYAKYETPIGIINPPFAYGPPLF
jgi:hypothetical protein